MRDSWRLLEKIPAAWADEIGLTKIACVEGKRPFAPNAANDRQQPTLTNAAAYTNVAATKNMSEKRTGEMSIEGMNIPRDAQCADVNGDTSLEH
ncbi:hypothetical protein [Falsirhodobacter sp. alg1]|uniref:hypothetical protein n=1 Tax=Falsirhodobacter sp. alg1 TaxID=1472418 RepID=UPI00128FBC40|nr:hypothetical protein [Falsirhodobacter sp. alg1]